MMDQLSQLKQWQRQHEQEVSQRHNTLIECLSQQNSKLNALVTDDVCLSNDRNDQCHSLPVSGPSSNIDQMVDDSIEQMRGRDSIDDDNSGDDSATPLDQSYINHSSASFSESSPVVPGIDGNRIKTFEQLLDMRLNDINSDSSAKTSYCKPKKPFLKKGEGLKRFEPNKFKLNEKVKSTAKEVCFKDNERVDQQIIREKTTPKFCAKNYLPRKKLHKMKSDESVNDKAKKFMRKVVPLTTKLSKSGDTRVEITRNAPTVIKGGADKESDLLAYLLEMYQNISVSDNEDVDDLKELLNKIESKERHILRLTPESETLFEGYVNEDNMNDNSKKKVRWGPDTQIINSDDSDQEMSDPLIQPKTGAYSSKLKQQISELEERLLLLKNSKVRGNGKKMSGKQLSESDGVFLPISNELSKLRQQIEKLNQRIVDMEAKSYDLLSDRRKDSVHRNQQMKCVFGQTYKPKPKTVSPNISVNETSMQTAIDFPNGDKMSVSKDNTIFYSFANGTTQTTYPDGLRITNFPNGQTEKLHKNGVKHITYANGLQRIINPDTSEEVLMTDGTIWRIHSDGSEVLEFADGDREIRTNKYKRREYRNGNIKTLYSDGTEETRYVSGRLRIKDRFGNLMVDSSVKHLNDHE